MHRIGPCVFAGGRGGLSVERLFMVFERGREYAAGFLCASPPFPAVLPVTFTPAGSGRRLRSSIWTQISANF
jgi:hypothetical protein